MRESRIVAFALGITLVSIARLPNAHGTAPARTVSALGADESVTFRFQSSGCWHDTAFSVVIDGATPDVASITDDYHRTPSPVQVPLTAEDRAGIDAVLVYYRNLHGVGRCTSRDWIQVRWSRGRRVLRTERFTDGTCDAGDVRGGLVMDQLAQRAFPN